MSINKYNGTELIEIAGKGNIVEDTKDCKTTFTSSDDSTESGLILPSGGDITVPQIKNDTHGNLFSGLSKVALNTRKLINTVKRLWNTVANEWVTGVNYSVGQVVTYIDGHTYICKTAHTSSASITPTNTTYWEDKTIGDMIAVLNSNYAKLNENVTQYSWGAGATAMNGTYTHDIANIPSGYYLAVISAMKSDRGTGNFAFIYLTIGVVGGNSSATFGCGHSGGTNCGILKLPNSTNTVRGTWRMDGLSSAVGFNPSMCLYRIRPL